VIHEGLYEQILTRALAEALKQARELRPELSSLPKAESHTYLARFLEGEIQRVLKMLPEVSQQAKVANAVLRFLHKTAEIEQEGSLEVATPEQLLMAVHRGEVPERPETSVAISTLLARPGKPELGHELAREIASSDRVDALVSFVTANGLRRLRWALDAHAQAGKPLRLLTTTYTGATEAEAVREVAKLRNAEVRISLDGRRTRLHAKAWLFHRKSGFTTAYIGSANLSASALGSGLEWMMKATESDLAHVIEVFRGSFDSLWNDPEFVPFDPEADFDRLEEALRDARGRSSGQRPRTGPIRFTLRPFPFQQEILDTLAEEREILNHRRNLIVAATGTGKTMIAAFDYARQPDRPRLLFLAHRRELLEQALESFRHVLRDESFGELLVGDEKPRRFDHLFASIPSLMNSQLIERLGAEHWSFAVVDECHHLPAPSYRAVIERLKPNLLLGLTATPERQDNQSLLPDFGGRIAAEIRLWHALEKQLVVPFEYYGLHDGTDLSDVPWNRGSYSVAALEEVYTGHDRRAELIAEQFTRLRGAWREARALGFCVSVGHADFMAQKFNKMGVPALSVHGETPAAAREAAPGRLRSRGVNVLFTCDLYNEGVDLPFVDTLLLLRPTSSAMVFLQQLGRGLRLEEGKASCLVLDFIGQHRREFRFDAILTAMTGIPRGRLRQAVEADFPSLPSGCHLHLDRVAREKVLESLKQTIGGGPARLARELAQLGPVSLAKFLEDTGRELDEVYHAGGWTTLRRAAGQLAGAAPEGEARLNERFRFLTHIDEASRLARYSEFCSTLNKPSDESQRRQLLMLAYQLYHEHSDTLRAADLSERLRPYSALTEELRDLFQLLHARAHPSSTPPVRSGWPLAHHRTYSRREIQTAIGHWSETAKPQSREGVLRLHDVKTEIFLVTLDKSEGHFSPTTSYEDYAISPERFHWQSQSQTSESSEAGRRYIEQATNGWHFYLFVRPTVDDEYVSLGEVSYESHSGSRPISIVWRLAHSMPPKLFESFATLLAA
jgi:superfamily II DNA or RNA helicase/HKD family nuclease